MGDMKTPDFDDLLAAFDIPDMVDPKAAIESGHDDHDSHIKQGAHVEDDTHIPSASDVGVSVIVKNVRTIDSSEMPEKDCHHSTGNGLPNGFLTVSSLDRFHKEELKSFKGNVVSDAILKESTFSQFSPISSAEEFDEDEKIEVDDPLDHQNLCSRFSANILTGSVSQQTYEKDKTRVGEHFVKSGIAISSSIDKNKESKKELEQRTTPLNLYEAYKFRKINEKLKESTERHLENKIIDGKADVDKNETNGDGISSKSSEKLSSCIAAIAALSAKKLPCDSNDVHLNAGETSPVPKEVVNSPLTNDRSPDSQLPIQNLIDGTRKVSAKQPDSPRSVSSENSSKGSPSSGGSTPAIPKVRIKTIKTSSGEIKRTVTRVLPDFEADGTKNPSDQTTSRVVSSLLSSPTSVALLSSPNRASVQPAVTTTASSTDMTPKQVTIKPVATAFLPVSAVKTAGSQVINLKFANNTTVKATVISAASVQSASNAIIKAANAIQQQTVVVPASSLANAKLVPKTVHFANLNLLPQGSQSTSELRQVLTKSHQPIKQTLVSATGAQPLKKVSRVQVVASSQSSVVEAFNKVLSSVNPVPVYLPNLSPPVNAGITLPARGYKCLECGDAFALEKSLLQHYDRRSVRIEVTCNHCAKNLVFYNKCSLLSHARGHKEKGVVMQCSHLILKPVPTDQMISSLQTNASSAKLGFFRPSPVALLAHSVAKVQASVSTPVISAPVSTPVTPAMPLDEDPTKLCRHSLKCLECNEVFQDETTLATHFQQITELSGQKKCSSCIMLLPNQCSYACHQRIHQHKSPYTCPECGAICRSMHFQTHVAKNCLHYARRIGYRCIHCSLFFSDTYTFKCHIQASHCELFYKCPVCPMAFKTVPSTQTHAYTQHPGVKIGEPKVIYKCSMCDTVFTHQTLLHRHFDVHIENQKVSIFNCPDCSLLYAQKHLMMDHIKTTHGTLKNVVGLSKFGEYLPLSTKPTTQNSTSPVRDEAKPVNGTENLEKKNADTVKKPGSRRKRASSLGWTCWDCDQMFHQRDLYITHMKSEHGKHLKKHPCRQCDKSFSSSHSLCRHNRIKHKGIRKVYACTFCTDTKRAFTKRVMLEKHIQLMHGIKDPDVNDSTDPSAPADKNDKKVSTLKRRREQPVLEFRPPRGAITQPLKKLKINVFKVHKCAVCGFTTENLLQFHEHIPQHKSDGSSYQCQECGLCYTSHVSLSRHLFIVHKLKEPQASPKQNGSGGKHQQNVTSNTCTERAGNTTSERTCKVCSRTFETDATLNTHMRTHGMAFIKSKRMSSTEK